MSMPVTKRRQINDLAELEGPQRRPRSATRVEAAAHVENEPIAELARLLGRQEDLSKAAGVTPGGLAKGAGAANGRLGGPGAAERKDPPPLERFITGDFAAIEAGLLGIGRAAQARLAAEPWSEPRRAFARTEPVVSANFAAIDSGAAFAERLEPTLSPHVGEIHAERSEPVAPAGFAPFDFAAIETELLNVRRQKLEAPRPDAETPDILAGATLLSDDESDASLDRPLGISDDDIRSRIPLYAIAAIIIAGLIGIGASFGSRSGEPSRPELAALDSADAAAALPAESRSGPNAAGFNDAPETPSVAANNPGQSDDLALAQENSPRVISLAEPAQSAPAVATEAAIEPPPQEPAQALAEPPAAVAPEAAQVRTVAVQPDGALVPNDAGPRPAAFAAPPAPRPAAKAQARKPAQHVAAAPKRAGAAASNGHAGPSAHAAKAKPIAVAAKPVPAQAANVPASAPAAAPAPAQPAGPFGFAQTAVNSITTGAAKLFDFGR